MSNKNQLFVMRDELYSRGLEDLIRYVNSFANTKEMDMVEIGSYAGESTVIFAKHFRRVVAIDPYLNDYDVNDITCQFMDLADVYSVFVKNITPYNNIELIKKLSDFAIRDLITQKFDFIYIDGLHTYDQIKKDIKNYYPLIKSGGFIAGHDYHPVYQGVMDGIIETIGYPDQTFVDTSWIKRVTL
jgi:predicted O-methyltransferase YrrM